MNGEGRLLSCYKCNGIGTVKGAEKFRFVEDAPKRIIIGSRDTMIRSAITEYLLRKL